jgi:pimeloyl-ACP methyl ester carboxylesterase
MPRRSPGTYVRELRGLGLHCTEWPGDGEPLVLLHGHMDCGATFQFLVDALRGGRRVVAPDWRGFGLSGWAPGGYWFPDYYADLDAWLDVLSPGRPADLVGHSMGGNVALAYAGVRPERVRRLVSLEGFGLPGTTPDLAPERYRTWLAQLRQPSDATTFPGVAALAGVLQRRNPRLTAARAAFIADAWAETLPDGRARLRYDPAHKRVNPVLYRREEAEACWRGIRGPLLYVAGAASDFRSRLGGAADPAAMRRWVPHLEARVVAGAGHMLHHDQPEAVAALLEEFLSREGSPAAVQPPHA